MLFWTSRRTSHRPYRAALGTVRAEFLLFFFFQNFKKNSNRSSLSRKVGKFGWSASERIQAAFGACSTGLLVQFGDYDRLRRMYEPGYVPFWMWWGDVLGPKEIHKMKRWDGVLVSAGGGKRVSWSRSLRLSKGGHRKDSMAKSSMAISQSNLTVTYKTPIVVIYCIF